MFNDWIMNPKENLQIIKDAELFRLNQDSDSLAGKILVAGIKIRNLILRLIRP